MTDKPCTGITYDAVLQMCKETVRDFLPGHLEFLKWMHERGMFATDVRPTEDTISLTSPHPTSTPWAY